jgi:hypothetical protein
VGNSWTRKKKSWKKVDVEFLKFDSLLQNFGDNSQNGEDETPNKRWKLGPTKHEFKKDFNMAFQISPLEAWEREGEWQPTTSVHTKGVDIGAII